MDESRIQIFSNGSLDYLRDSDLRLQAKGLLAECLYLVPLLDEFVGSETIVGFGADNLASVQRSMRELERTGYLVRSRIYAPGRRGVQWLKWSVYESLSLKLEGGQ